MKPACADCSVSFLSRRDRLALHAGRRRARFLRAANSAKASRMAMVRRSITPNLMPCSATVLRDTISLARTPTASSAEA
jgi:hypothetical protein